MRKRIAILTRSDDKSPKVLAISFQQMCSEIGVETKIFFQGTSMLSRLFFLTEKTMFARNWHFKIRHHLYYLLSDIILLIRLLKYDIILISECIPNAHWRGYYNIERLKKLTKKPVVLYEVYCLLNSMTHTKILKEGNHYGYERYDWNYSISRIAELRGIPDVDKKWTDIGLNIQWTGLTCNTKKEIIALVDFEQVGFESSLQEQIDVLESFPMIKIIRLKGSYKATEIRELYKKASLFFIQFPEAFGVSIAECLSTGCQIIVKDMNWAMSWRLQNDIGEEYLPDCFFVYQTKHNLYQYIKKFIDNHDADKTPKNINDIFLCCYPEFYYGNSGNLLASLAHIKVSA
jgi:hypothetical protein